MPQVTAAARRHPRCFRLLQLFAELAPLGEVFEVSQAPKIPAP
jgi:hypothetical protein